LLGGAEVNDPQLEGNDEAFYEAVAAVCRWGAHENDEGDKMTHQEIHELFTERTGWSQYYWAGYLDSIIQDLQGANEPLQSPRLARAIDSAMRIRSECFANLFEDPEVPA
jgi:hypothetical protein